MCQNYKVNKSFRGYYQKLRRNLKISGEYG